MEALMSFGIQGPKGDTGPQGPRGATGPQGPAGSSSGKGLRSFIRVNSILSSDVGYDNKVLYSGGLSFAILCEASYGDDQWVQYNPGQSYSGNRLTVKFTSSQITATGTITSSTSYFPRYIFVY